MQAVQATQERQAGKPGKASRAGETVAIMVVLQLPPRESSRMRVSLESL